MRKQDPGRVGAVNWTELSVPPSIGISNALNPVFMTQSVLSDAVAALALPQPRINSEISVEHCLLKRRSVRSFRNAALSLADISQLLWAAQGIAAEGHLRTAPSAGALYPLEVYLVAGNADGLEPGAYHYRPKRHELVLVKAGDFRRELDRAALGQDCVVRVRRSSCWRQYTLAPAASTGNAGRATSTWKLGTRRRMSAFRPPHLGLGPSQLAHLRMTK